MNHTASFGKNKGIINLEENHCAEYDDLEEILLYYSEITHTDALYQWLLENSKKTGEFMDIDMHISDDDEYAIHFEWSLRD